MIHCGPRHHQWQQQLFTYHFISFLVFFIQYLSRTRTHTHTHLLTSSHAFADRVRESESMLAYIGWIRLIIHACALCSVLTARYRRYIFHFGRTSSLYFPHHLVVVLYMMSAIHGARLNQYIRYLYISYIYIHHPIIRFAAVIQPFFCFCFPRHRCCFHFRRLILLMIFIGFYCLVACLK